MICEKFSKTVGTYADGISPLENAKRRHVLPTAPSPTTTIFNAFFPFSNFPVALSFPNARIAPSNSSAFFRISSFSRYFNHSPAVDIELK